MELLRGGVTEVTREAVSSQLSALSLNTFDLAFEALLTADS